MKKLGMNVEQIEDVQSIVIKTPKGNYIFDSAEVSAMTMQGQTTYQVTGSPGSKQAAPEIPDEDVTHGRGAGKRIRRESKRSACRNERRYCRSHHAPVTVMIESGDRVLLVGEGREFFVKAGPGTLSTDKGQLDLAPLVGSFGRGHHDHP